MNTMVPEPVIPSHQGPDARTVIPGLDVVTIAAKGARTHTHNHYWTLQLTRRASRDPILDALRAAPRIAFIRMSDGLVALNSTVELMRDFGRPRGDMWEVAVWEDLVTVDGEGSVIVAEKYREAVHGDEMLPKAAADAVMARIPFVFGVNDFTIVRKAWEIGPAKSGSKEQLPKSDGYCVYSPAFKQFVYRPKLVDRIVEETARAEDFESLLGRAPMSKSAT